MTSSVCYYRTTTTGCGYSECQLSVSVRHCGIDTTQSLHTNIQQFAFIALLSAPAFLPLGKNILLVFFVLTKSIWKSFLDKQVHTFNSRNAFGLSSFLFNTPCRTKGQINWYYNHQLLFLTIIILNVLHSLIFILFELEIYFYFKVDIVTIDQYKI